MSLKTINIISTISNEKNTEDIFSITLSSRGLPITFSINKNIKCPYFEAEEGANKAPEVQF